MEEFKSEEDVLGQRVYQQGKYGSIRFLGKLIGNAKAGDDLWLGIEWDEEGKGRHNGTVDGRYYFNPEWHKNSENSCSFIRFGKIRIGGISFEQGLDEKYKPEAELSDAELKLRRQQEEIENYVRTDKKGGMKKIEILGQDKSYTWRADVSNSRDISLENLKIASLGALGAIKKHIPGAMNLYLDHNMLYSWE